MTPSELAETEAKKTYKEFLKISKAVMYWIFAILLILAFFDFGADRETGSQYDGSVYAPSNMGDTQ